MKLRYKLPFFNWLAQLFQKVSGIPPLTLPRAVAGGLKEVTAYGGCALNGIPSEYTELEYIQSSGSQYIDTGRVPNMDDIIEQKFQKTGNSQTTCSWYGSMPASSVVVPRICIGSYNGTGQTLTFFASSNNTNNLAVGDTNIHTLRFQTTGVREFTYTLDGVTNAVRAPSTTNMYEPAVQLTSYLFARHGTNGVQTYDNEGTKIYYHREYLANGTIVLDMIPAKRNSDNKLGMYDRVSQRFFTNQGTGTFIAGNVVTPSPDKPCEIWCNNGKLIPYLNAEGSSTQDGIPSPDNPVEIRNYTQGNMILRGVGDYKDIYNSSTKSITRKIGTMVLTGEEDWVRNVTSQNFVRSYTILPDAYTKESGRTSVICTHYHNIGNISSNEVNGLFLGNDGKLWIVNSDDPAYTLKMFTDFVKEQYQNGTPVVAYYPLATETTETWNDVVYVEGTQEIITVGNSSASAEYLLRIKMVDYSTEFIDSQYLLNGNITRNCKIKVYNGSESFILNAQGTNYVRFRTSGINSDSYSGSYPLLCSHFKAKVSGSTQGYSYITNKYFYFTYKPNTTVNDFKQFLTDQYNAGTPVIVVYPLATPVTEQVTPQALDTGAGTNTLEITQASLPGLELAAEYKRH